ncbi:DUF4133 domain-containing protein [Sphingobacterium phlebotomi]|uniref:DUF4133 domain-containing protein n=1 Tax=Sphingobacterium phlebotomi TaxID=2605433 RepID=A0A5D4HB33_9SPHI|nr:DUF4133 domain-containing protein [Sphingobacterium phlebotomi]TYR37413.1 DUF4133 domain-containing protein [Sphingobacterium phlebotomi]
MKKDTTYIINKGINRSIEFRGLKAQYIYILAIGMVILLIGFVVCYIAGVPVYLCLPIVLLLGLGLFVGVYRLSNRYGVHGLMKELAYRQVPSAIIYLSRKVFWKDLKQTKW